MNTKITEEEAAAIELLKSRGYKVMLDPNFIDPNILYLIRFTENDEEKFVMRRTERGRGPQKKGAEITKLVLDELSWSALLRTPKEKDKEE